MFGGTLALAPVLSACGLSEGETFDGSDVLASTDEALVSCSPPAISANHGHTMTVTAAEVSAAVTKTYSIQGSAGHAHQVTVTAAQFRALGLGGTVTVASTTGAGHTHSVTVRCAVSQPVVCANGTSATIAANHGHLLSIPRGDVVAGVAKTYSIQGTATHLHQVTVSAAQFATLKRGATVSTTSSNGAGHTHGVTLRCA